MQFAPSATPLSVLDPPIRANCLHSRGRTEDLLPHQPSRPARTRPLRRAPPTHVAEEPHNR